MMQRHETAPHRDAWLRQEDAALLRECREERYRASGPGGQRRNKVETAVRLTHRPSGVTAHAEEARSLQENRTRAVHRLKKAIALAIRAPLDLEDHRLPPELLAYRAPQGSLSINPRNPAYPLVLATLLDALHATGGSYARAARALGLTTSQLIKTLQADSEAWRGVSNWTQTSR